MIAALVFAGTGLIALLINLLIVLLVLGLIYWIITLLPVPPLFLRIAQVVLAIIAILYLCSLLTGCSGDGTLTYTDKNGQSVAAHYGYAK